MQRERYLSAPRGASPNDAVLAQIQAPQSPAHACEVIRPTSASSPVPDNRYPFGDDAAELSEHAWFWDNANERNPGRRPETGQRLGLHNMLGSVEEWVQDSWRPDYGEAPADGSAVVGRTGDDRRVVRGGCWRCGARHLRLAYRNAFPANTRSPLIGFRIAWNLTA